MTCFMDPQQAEKLKSSLYLPKAAVSSSLSLFGNQGNGACEDALIVFCLEELQVLERRMNTIHSPSSKQPNFFLKLTKVWIVV